ncbi:MAG: transposase [Acetobacteraceae bacterium]|nr:transposase [Acetobacteraceae bacterium]
MSTRDATEARRQRGLAIAALCKITQKNGQWIVPSQTGNGTYRVNLNPPNPAVPLCTCDDFAKRGQKCKHVFAVEFVLSREQGDPPLEAVDVEAITSSPRRPPTVAPRPTYKQDWPAYDRAQTTEKRQFQALLADLCGGIPEPARTPGRGRKPIPLADQVFAAVFKIYSTVSARRFMCDLSDACAKGYIAKVPHFTSIADTLEMTTVTPILQGLIVESAKPLRALETDFVVDSSGFATSRFVRWFDHKYGKPMQEYDWVKCHVMTGVKTNVVSAVEIEGRYAADSPQFQPLLKATSQNFTVREVSADSAYLSYENADAVAALGGMPYILPKSNTTGGKGGMLEKMFHLYSFKREEFLAHYHKRSNVESTL